MQAQTQMEKLYPVEFPQKTVNALLGVQVGKLVVRYYTKKVSVSCRYQGQNYGSAGKDLYQALYFISERIKLNQFLQKKD